MSDEKPMTVELSPETIRRLARAIAEQIIRNERHERQRARDAADIYVRHVARRVDTL